MKKILIILILICLTSCSGKKKEDPEKATEVPNKEVIKTDLPSSELLQKSKHLYENALYTSAVESFQSLRDSYSPGPYTEFSEIKMADCNFEIRKFDAAALNYEEFIKSHPSSKSIPYVMLRAGRSFELSNKGVGRDVAPLEKAKDYYEKLINQYPESVYTSAARSYYQSVAKKLSDQEHFVKDFYSKKNKQEAAKAREEHYASSIQPILQKANYQASSEYEEKIKNESLEKNLKARAIIESDSQPQTIIKRKVPEAEAQERKTTYRIQSVQCSQSNGEKLFVFLNKEMLDNKLLEENASLANKDGIVELQLPDTQSKETEMDCFSIKDLKVTENGKISLKSSSGASLIPLKNPPRLLISID